MELEKLLVMIILVETELICESQYLNELNRQFLIDSKNDLLLELEVLHNNTHDAFDKIMNNYFHINERVFGEALLEKIGEIYVSNQLTIHEFGAKCI